MSLPPFDAVALDATIDSTRVHLLSMRNASGHWEGQLSSSALSTATAIVALGLIDAELHAEYLHVGRGWLVEHQNPDGGWGDTSISKSNLSTTLLVWSALGLMEKHLPNFETSHASVATAEAWISKVVGSLAPDDITRAVIARYGKDKTFSVPILMLATLCGRLGDNGWRRVLPLPFELAVLPRAWFGAVGLPVVSYALPALIAIGNARFFHAPPARWNPLYWLRRWAWKRVSPMLLSLQPSSGGYLEATPLTSFVSMALAGSGELQHPALVKAVEFLRRSMRADGSWPIDTNLATWGTTLSIKALQSGGWTADPKLKQWLLEQQYQTTHPFTNAAPGGWAWTDLPGGVPDADDTAGALIALALIEGLDENGMQPSPEALKAAKAGAKWLVDLQNNDGGIPTFCRGWGTLPFDRSSPELTSHALAAWAKWMPFFDAGEREAISTAVDQAFDYLDDELNDGHWQPLWFGNEHCPEEANHVYGTAQVINGLCAAGTGAEHPLLLQSVAWLVSQQQERGGWGGCNQAPPSTEETAVALEAIARYSLTAGHPESLRGVLQSAVEYLIEATRQGSHFPATPIGLYFARLWYHEQLYPVVWTLGALHWARRALHSCSAS
jgi:squalene-hopene/tetraprenyl-beta-curcumene cyclase